MILRPHFKFLFLFFFVGALNLTYAQEHPKSDFNKHEAFAPLFLNEMANSFHSATGEPGPDYWQNNADYKIQATLDTLNHRITGKMTLTYTNNSPYDLEFIWLQMDQNAFREDSRSKALYPANDRNGVRTPTQGYELKNVSVGKNKAKYFVDDTRMKVYLDQPLKAKGKKVSIDIEYAFEIPTHGKDRMGRVETKNGWIYTLAQWYPRVAVLDEVEGWNNIPYLGTGEFYLEYGDFEYEITAPNNMTVVGSGVLQNPKQVMTKTQLDRMERAKKSDKTVTIISKEEMREGNHHLSGKNGMLTWKFKMKNTRDIAWAASKGFIWDAAKMDLGNGKIGLAQSVYPEENSGQDGYARSTEYTKGAVEFYSKNLYPYPYEVATNVGAHEGGMEYPGIVFCSYKSRNSSLWGVINHEFGHIWFPMIVGSNERVHAWLDEGLNTFINDLATEAFNSGEYHRNENLQNLGGYMFHKSWDPLFTRADVIHNQQKLGIEAYFKPATALHVLRNSVLGKERFDEALNTYIDRWKFKHPQPWDFFNTMSNVSGEDLGWFFRGWFMENWAIDQSVESIDYKYDEPENGAEIKILNRGELPMPVVLEITYTDGDKERVNLPVEIWMTGAEYTYHLDSTKEIASVEIDPDKLVPDSNAANNYLKKLPAAPAGITAKQVLQHYLEVIGGQENIENIHSLALKLTATIQGTPFNVEDYFEFPSKYQRTMEVFGQNMLDIRINGSEVSLSSQGRVQEIDEEDRDYLISMSQDKFREVTALNKQYSLKLLGMDEIKGNEVYAVEMTSPKKETFIYYYDVKSGYKLMEIDASGYAKSFGDYKEVNGIVFPHTIYESMIGFGKDVKMEVKEISINEKIDPVHFKIQ